MKKILFLVAVILICFAITAEGAKKKKKVKKEVRTIEQFIPAIKQGYARELLYKTDEYLVAFYKVFGNEAQRLKILNQTVEHIFKEYDTEQGEKCRANDMLLHAKEFLHFIQDLCGFYDIQFKHTLSKSLRERFDINKDDAIDKEEMEEFVKLLFELMLEEEDKAYKNLKAEEARERAKLQAEKALKDSLA
jgi:hypothetical protein